MAILSRLKRAKPPKTEVVTKTPKTDCEVVTFARLDYWSMLDLFDRIPVHDLVRLNGLASWWSGYVTKVCRTKRDITVQCGHKDRFPTADHTQNQFNLLKVTIINPHTSDRLGRLLPSITSLEIIIEKWQTYKYRYDFKVVSKAFADIAYLISKWSHQLVNLTLKCHLFCPHYYRKVQFEPLLLSLNTITSLRRLTINCKWWANLSIDSIDWPILSQLEYFKFYTGDIDYNILRHSLVRYAGPNHHLKQIVLPSLIWTLPIVLNDLLGERQLLSKFTMLKLGGRHYGPNQVTRDQWELFPNLTKVDLGFISSRFEVMKIITGMQCLKLIRNLKMELNITREFDRDQAPIDLPQLSSVTNLKLLIVAYWPTNSYPSFKSLQLGTIFPNLESVHLGYEFDCSPSSYRVIKWTGKIWSKISYRAFKLRVRRELTGVECTFRKPFLYLNKLA